MHQCELATGIYVSHSPHPEPHCHLPPHPIPLGCPRAPALGALLHAPVIYQQMKEVVVHVCSGILFSYKKESI